MACRLVATTGETQVKRTHYNSYEVSILWQKGQPSLPNNRLLAESRFINLLRRFQADPEFEESYRKAMEKNFEEGYAVIVDEEDGRPEYYLFHHGLRKGEKTRVVFDAAAKFQGKCLNDSILSGPALRTPLPAVIFKFREGEVAWTLDVGAMFSRIRLRKDDCRFFRFLWRRKGEERNQVCEFKRLPFGATCSPFIAISMTRRAVMDFSDDPKIVEAITT